MSRLGCRWCNEWAAYQEVPGCEVVAVFCFIGMERGDRSRVENGLYVREECVKFLEVHGVADSSGAESSLILRLPPKVHQSVELWEGCCAS